MALPLTARFLDFLDKSGFLVPHARERAAASGDENPVSFLLRIEQAGLLKPGVYEVALKRFDFALHVGIEGPKLQMALRAGYVKEAHVETCRARQLVEFADGRGELVPIVELLTKEFVTSPVALRSLINLFDQPCELGRACPYRASMMRRLDGGSIPLTSGTPIGQRKRLTAVLLLTGAVSILFVLRWAVSVWTSGPDRPVASTRSGGEAHSDEGTGDSLQDEAGSAAPTAEGALAHGGGEPPVSHSETVVPSPSVGSSTPSTPSSTSPPSLQDLFRRLEPSVVVIVTQDRAGVPLSQGSGFVLTEDGLIATNEHVVRNAASFTVTFHNGDQVGGSLLLATDSECDLALLSVPRRECSPATLGDSASLAPGQSVFAITTPQGYSRTMSNGIVSGVRDATAPGLKTSMVQISVPISHGSSGGPLFDLEGRVVGVCTATRADAQNLNFAIPSNALQRLWDRTKRGAQHPPIPAPPAAASEVPATEVSEAATAEGDSLVRLSSGRLLIGNLVYEDAMLVILCTRGRLLPLARSKIVDIRGR